MEEDIIMEKHMRNVVAASASVLVILLLSTQCASLAWNPSTSNLKVTDSTSNYDVADVLNAEGRFYLDANGG